MGKITISIIAKILIIYMVGCGNIDVAETAIDTLGQRSMEQYEMVEITSLQYEEQTENELSNHKEEEISVKSSDYEIIYKLNDSQAAKELYTQLPLTIEVKPYSNNEMTFYPPKRLDTANASLSSGEVGSLSYYAPWGGVVMFYAPGNSNESLYELGTIVSGKDDIEKLKETITISAYEK